VQQPAQRDVGQSLPGRNRHPAPVLINFTEGFKQ
jgi:hypothetical protein